MLYMFARAELRKQIILDLKIHGGEDETALPTFHMGISSQHGEWGLVDKEMMSRE